MHWEEQDLMALLFRHNLNHRLLLTVSLNFFRETCAKPLLFPRSSSLHQPLLQVDLFHLTGNNRISPHHVKGTTVKHNQATRRHIRKSLLFEPTLKNPPVKLTMIISLALLRFKSKQCFIDQSLFLHGMHETPPSAFPTQTLHIIMV